MKPTNNFFKTYRKGEKNNTKGQKSNEMKSELDDLPPIEELQISVPEVLCDPLGEVFINYKLISN